MDETASNKIRQLITPIATGWATIILIPAWYAFQKFNSNYDTANRVNPLGCNCNCWDGILRTAPKNSAIAYKHFYINITGTSFKIWILAITGVIILYESIKHLTKLIIAKKVRYSMLLLFTINVYPHIFIWWSFINQLNDGFHDPKDKKLLYISSGLLNCTVILHLVNSINRLTFSKLATIFAIGVAHLCSQRHQFIVNLLQDDSSQYVSFKVFDLISMMVSLITVIIKLNQNERFGSESKADLFLYVFAVATYCHFAEKL